MRVAQIVLAGAPEFEKKSQRIDRDGLANSHEVMTYTEPADLRGIEADVAHVYGPAELPHSLFVGFTIPYLASARIAERRFSWRKPAQPARVVTPLKDGDGELLPEAVDETFFAVGPAPAAGVRIIGTYGPFRPDVRRMIEQTTARLERLRDDVRWQLFDGPPTPQTLQTVDLWVDPTSGERDYDGFVAEAVAAGRPVVATRTPINEQRLEKGRTGFVIPRGDPNELLHAILSALFKPELARTRLDAARQTASKYRPRQRLRSLQQLYENLIR